MANRWVTSDCGLFYCTLILLATFEMAKSKGYEAVDAPSSSTVTSIITEPNSRHGKKNSFGPAETTTIPPYEDRGCGHRNVNGIISQQARYKNGEAEFGEFPWVTAIFRRRFEPKLEYLCVGTLIEVAAVLTTAGCIQRHRSYKHMLEVRLGEWDMGRVDEPIPSITMGVQKVHLHPRYDMTAKVNDIAIIILTDTVELTHTVGVACLPDASVDVNYFVAAGWGKVPRYIDPTELSQTGLKKANLHEIDHKTCQRKLRSKNAPKYNLHNSFICADCSLPEISSYRPNIGSPYMVSIRRTVERYYVVGITSWDKTCGTRGIPTVLTSVSYHREWIDEVVRNADLSPLVYTYNVQETD